MHSSRTKLSTLIALSAAAVLLGAALLFAAPGAAQTALPEGTILPVSLDRGLNAQKLHAGQKIHARIMQSIPGTRVHRGSQVLGHVVRVTAQPNGASTLELRFDAVESAHRRIPVQVHLRALASPLEVEFAQIPEEMSSRGLTPETWDTEQIGGDQVYRGGGPVAENNKPVGKPVAYGVEATPQTRPGGPCRGESIDNTRVQALWLFSANACGIYGFPYLRIEDAGRSNGGSIVLTARKGKLSLGGGSALLLRVQN
ncbi:MAG: hypothetical protein ACLGP3_11140 [Acidobacteriota bacterium]